MQGRNIQATDYALTYVRASAIRPTISRNSISGFSSFT
jgi:hypothetical protein